MNAKDELELHKVSIGNDLGTLIQITAGLDPSDRIVASPPDYVVNGMPASIQPPARSNKNSDTAGDAK